VEYRIQQLEAQPAPCGDISWENKFLA